LLPGLLNVASSMVLTNMSIKNYELGEILSHYLYGATVETNKNIMISSRPTTSDSRCETETQTSFITP
jgi:hypothetical protein